MSYYFDSFQEYLRLCEHYFTLLNLCRGRLHQNLLASKKGVSSQFKFSPVILPTDEFIKVKSFAIFYYLRSNYLQRAGSERRNASPDFFLLRQNC